MKNAWDLPSRGSCEDGLLGDSKKGSDFFDGEDGLVEGKTMARLFDGWPSARPRKNFLHDLPNQLAKRLFDGAHLKPHVPTGRPWNRRKALKSPGRPIVTPGLTHSREEAQAE
jgi:hypothetical protein